MHHPNSLAGTTAVFLQPSMSEELMLSLPSTSGRRDMHMRALIMAAQVLRRRYGKEADIWSVGVILYILLCGVPPFWGDTEQDIFHSILKGKLDFDSDPWPRISPDAKNCVRLMLQQARTPLLTTSHHSCRLPLWMTGINRHMVVW